MLWLFVRKGNIIHVRALHQHIIILNGLKEATDLMHTRGGLYSGREQKVMMHELYLSPNPLIIIYVISG